MDINLSPSQLARLGKEFSESEKKIYFINQRKDFLSSIKELNDLLLEEQQKKLISSILSLLFQSLFFLSLPFLSFYSFPYLSFLFLSFSLFSFSFLYLHFLLLLTPLLYFPFLKRKERITRASRINFI